MTLKMMLTLNEIVNKKKPLDKDLYLEQAIAYVTSLKTLHLEFSNF